ncbi:unnamed protein product [Mytilus coruscus]|uniref:Reverse transcriptase domain-containing protein n=1 Tax=Mytilus coruscus TaxID=42192 RepID=A0A6J8BJ63_MYTCO|nr:unnamed protein product [Mytilus coruscus]
MYLSYKNSKNCFRNELRRVYDEYVADMSNDIEKSIDVDQRLAWCIINSRRSRNTSDILLKLNNKLVNDPESVCAKFANLFEAIAKTSDHTEDKVNIKLLNLIRNRCDNDSIRPVYFEELSKLVINLPNGKACGLDGISYEHLKYGGKLLLRHLCNLFNLIFDQCITPVDWKTSVVIPLFKGGKKLKSDIESYRGISLIPCISKVFQKLLDNRLNERLINFPNNQQIAYQKYLSSIYASFNLQETVHHYKERNSSIQVTFLDSKRALDTVDHIGLKIKINDLGIHGNLWKLLDHMYRDLKSCVRCNNVVSTFFSLESGVRQGSALSAKLYLIYINDLIDILSTSGKGAVMLDLNVGCPVQADDIALISPTFAGMQCMIDICYNNSVKWKVEFSPSKSQVLIFSKRTETYGNLKLNTDIIPVCNSVKHVGILLDARFNLTKRTLAACSKIRSVCMSIIRLGVHPSLLNPITCSKIIVQLCYSKGLYGCELWNNLTKHELLLLERTHRYICKYVQGLPKLTRTDKCTSLLGWIPIESIININKLLFFGRLCNMPSKYLSKNVLMARLLMFFHKCTENNFGFVNDVIRIMQKYNLVGHIEKLLSTSYFPVQNQWKSIVKKRVYEYEENVLKQRLDSDRDFEYFKLIHNSIEPHRAWTILRQYPSLKFQAKFVISLCAVVRPSEPDAELLLCHKCGFFYDNAIVHILIQCSSVSSTRDLFWIYLINIGPTEFSTTLHAMEDTYLTLTLLSCNSNKFFLLEKSDADSFTYSCVKFINRLCNEYDS